MPSSEPTPLRFSIIVPARNESHLLPSCLDSLAHQNYGGTYEIIVVDNDSTDQTATIASNYGATVVTEKRLGVCAARQKGVETANFEVIISTDADTTFDPSWLQKINDAFHKKPGTVAVGGSVKFTDAPIWARVYPKLLFGLVGLFARVFRQPFYISACNVAFQKAAFDGYNVNLTQGGDELFVLKRLRHKGFVRFENSNPVFTSARRLRRGLIYSFFVTFLTYYVLDYALSRVLNRSLFGSFPEFRDNVVARPRLFRFVRRVAVATVLSIVIAVFPLANAFARNSARIVSSQLQKVY